MVATLDLAAILGGIQTLSILAAAFLGGITLVLGLRIWTRAVILRGFHADDHFAIVSYVCFVINATSVLLQDHMVTGLFKGSVLDFNKLIVTVKIGVCTYILSMATIKISLGTFFLRIFTVQQMQRYVIWSITAVTVALAVAFLALAGATCGPQLNFVPGVKDCPGAKAYAGVALAWSYVNAVTSFILSGLAMNAMWKADLRSLLKISTSIVLVIGTLGGIASIARIVIISSDNGGDAQMQGIRYGWWSIIESGTGLVAACLACLRPLFKQLVEHTMALRGASREPADRHKPGPGAPSTRAPMSVKEWTVETTRIGGAYTVLGPVNEVRIEAGNARKQSVGPWASDRATDV